MDEKPAYFSKSGPAHFSLINSLFQMIAILKTNITTERKDTILDHLKEMYPTSQCTVDLEDHDRVLRVKGEGVELENVMQVVRYFGFHCEELP